MKGIKVEHTVATDPKEIKYIKKRCRKAFREKICFYICRIFPIKKKLISVCTFEGKGGFGCNAKPLVKKLHEMNPEYEFVWFVNDMSKKFPQYIKKVPNTLWSRAYWLTRSSVWIDNYRKLFGTCKRKGQYYLNVNHYTIGIKCTGLLRGEGFSEMAYLVSKNDSDMIDDLVIDSDWCEQCFDKALVYEGTFLKTGAPRCDVLYGDRSLLKERFHGKYNLPEGLYLGVSKHLCCLILSLRYALNSTSVYFCKICCIIKRKSDNYSIESVCCRNLHSKQIIWSEEHNKKL